MNLYGVTLKSRRNKAQTKQSSFLPSTRHFVMKKNLCELFQPFPHTIRKKALLFIPIPVTTARNLVDLIFEVFRAETDTKETGTNYFSKSDMVWSKRVEFLDVSLKSCSAFKPAATFRIQNLLSDKTGQKLNNYVRTEKNSFWWCSANFFGAGFTPRTLQLFKRKGLQCQIEEKLSFFRKFPLFEETNGFLP